MTNLYADKISQACTPIWMQKDFGGSYYVGSGQFVSLSQDLDGNPTDLAEGYLLTCAHNLEKASGAGDHYKLYYQHAGTWRTLPEWTYVDGIADLAIIRTGRLQNAAHVLKMAPAAPVTGQKVWMCGFPGGHDTDSIVSGIIRDAHFNLNDGGQAVDSLFISSSGIGGNSGSAILDNNGDIIGIFTFAYTEHETFGGGANWNTMKSSFTRLNNGRNTAKKFVGINWERCSPFTLEDYYPATDAGGITVLEPTPLSKGCKITAIHALSPFNANFVVGDIILDATVTSGNDPGLQNWTFGFMNNQFTPGIIHYLYNTTQLSITKIGVNKIKETVLVDLMTTFADLGTDKLALDTYLDGGTSVVAQSNLIQEGI
jgi:S1-C subfamily serine protease